MVDVMNALTRPSSIMRTNRKKYKDNVESFDEKVLGFLTSKYFECNDNVSAKFSNEKQLTRTTHPTTNRSTPKNRPI